MVFKCDICGGNLEVKKDSKVVTCEYCGNEQTLPKFQSEQKLKLFDRASHFRANNEYDKAIALYENILLEDSTDSEIYWQLVLCEYGVEYVKDKASDKYIPTCNRTQKVSVFANENYKNAIKYSDDEQKKIYEEEAKKIDTIQKNALEIANNEEPFDIFICYKETDENGKRTQDSVMAQDLYNNLTQQGYKVFFAKITLENKLGTEYEPYIFSALNSSKVMIVLGTKKEYFNSPWVKNEWSRFLNLTKESNDKVLIPAYRDMDPYDLPEEFAHLQALDLGKIGIFSDLKNKIDVTLHKDKKENEKTTKKVDKAKRKKLGKIISTIICIILLLVTGVILTINFIIPEMKYKEAEKLMDEEKYNEAITAFEAIKEYKDSEDKIFDCNNLLKEQIDKSLEKYVGTYDKTENKIDPANGAETPYGYILDVESADSSGIQISLTNCGHRVAVIGSRAKLKGDIYEFSFVDSWGNKGKGTLKLLDEGITINLEITQYDEMANFDIGQGEIEFKFSNKTK